MTAWTDHVKKMASDLGITYKNAMSDARVKGSFTKAPKQPRAKKSEPLPPRTTTLKERRQKASARAIEMMLKPKADGSVNDFVAYNRPVLSGEIEISRPGSREMPQEVKDMLKARRQAKKASEAPPPRTTTMKERRQKATARMVEVMGGNNPFPEPKEPKKRKPMSEETKAMLKARREAKKEDVAKKFEAFWARHEQAPAASAITESIADMIGGAVSSTPSGSKRVLTDEQKAKRAKAAQAYKEKQLNPRDKPSSFGPAFDAFAERVRLARLDPKMRKRLKARNVELKKQGLQLYSMGQLLQEEGDPYRR